MIVLNFSHYLTNKIIKQLEEKLGDDIQKIIDLDAKIDMERPLAPQISTIVDRVGFNSYEWQSLRFIVNPPSLNVSAMTLLAEIHGRCGYFPPIIRLKPLRDNAVVEFEMAEIINLQKVRNEARLKR
ncbi:MAG: CRISPR-associated protein Csx15 [Pseudothermotoga sp.]